MIESLELDSALPLPADASSCHLELDNLLLTIMERAGALLGTSHGYIYLLDETLPEPELYLAIGSGCFTSHNGFRLKKGEGLSGTIWLTGKPLTVEDYQHSSYFLTTFEPHHYSALVGVPLYAASKFQGVLGLAFSEPGKKILPAEVDTLVHIAQLASIALENTRLYSASQQELAERKRTEAALRASEEKYRKLYSAAQRQAMELGLLDRVRTATLLELDLSGVIRTVVEEIVNSFGYTQVSLYLLENDETLVLRHQIGYSTPITHIPVINGVMGRVVRTGQPVLLKDVSEDPSFLGAIDGVNSEVCVPLLENGRVAGTLNVETIKGVALTEDDLRLMIALSQYVNLAITRARLYSDAREIDKKYRLVIESVREVIFQTDLAGNWSILNSAWSELTGYSIDESLGGFFLNYIFPEDRQYTADFIYPLLERRVDFCRHEVRFVTKSGRICWFDMHAHVTMDNNSQVIGISGILVDITERKQTEEALRESEERYALAVAGAKDGLWDWDLKSNKLYLSPRWREMLGYNFTEMYDAPEIWMELIHPEDRDNFNTQLTNHLKGLTNHFEYEYRILHADSNYRWFLTRGIAVRDSYGRAYRMAGSITDITSRKIAETRLEKAALRDNLTGLPNRTLFMHRLTSALDKSKQQPDYNFAVLFIDLDRFKLVNDSLGHSAGDQLLVAIARRLESCLRSIDMVARLGGDEFTILLSDISDASDAMNVADRIQQALKLPFNLVGQEIFTSASIGIALNARDFQFPEDFLRSADTAMYRAKAHGKACFEVYDSNMHTRVLEMLRLETDLRRAIEREEFQVYYQPIIELSTGKLSGFEALLRWQHPERGLVSPAEFLPLAEETGLIIPIGQWVLEVACRDAQTWNKQFGIPLTVSVNLAGKQLFQTDLIEMLERVLAESGLSANFLRLEITEGTIMENTDLAISILNRLKGLGLQLYLDDFGTGYSSLSWLHRFPLDVLKIDRSFINRLNQESGNPVLVEAIATMAHSLGLKVVAEGVETLEQLDQLKQWECEYGQGYFFSRPLNLLSTQTLIDNWPV